MSWYDPRDWSGGGDFFGKLGNYAKDAAILGGANMAVGLPAAAIKHAGLPIAKGAAGVAQKYFTGSDGSGGSKINKDAFNMSEEQKELAAMLKAQASGQGVSPAELQQKRAFEAAAAQQMALAASGRGVNPALASRNAAYNIGNQQQALAGQAAELRAQEQMRAQQMLAQLYGGNQANQIQLAQMEYQAQLAEQQQREKLFYALLGAGSTGLASFIGSGGSGNTYIPPNPNTPAAGVPFPQYQLQMPVLG